MKIFWCIALWAYLIVSVYAELETRYWDLELKTSLIEMELRWQRPDLNVKTSTPYVMRYLQIHGISQISWDN